MTHETLKVWAPAHDRVSILLDGAVHPMRKDAAGWFTPVFETAPSRGEHHPHEHDYGFLLGDGTDPRPDPRSHRQPDGVHGLSRTFDPSAHEWSDASWTGRQLAGGVIYELHIGTFTPEGTLDSAIDRLDHLVELGISFVEVLPVNAFNGTHNWGYDGVLWYAVQESYGGPAAYQRFVDACHARGLAVIQDVVYNHLGPSGNYLPEFGPYLSSEKGNTWGSSVNLDGEHSDEVRRYIIDNALMWLSDYHVDGLRLDAVHALTDERAQHVLEQLATEVDVLSAHLGKPLTLIAESDLNNPTLITPREAAGYGLTAQWSDDFHHAVHVALTRETTGYYEDFDSLAALAKVLTAGFFHDGTLSSFRGRVHGRKIDTERMPAWRLVTFAQDHDQIGNRAIGDRLTATLNDDQLALAAVLLLVSPFTPMLFMGEEWGAKTPWQFFTSHPEPELGKATAEGRIAEFERMGWDPAVVPDPQDPATFSNSKLDWTELDGDSNSRLLDVYRRLIALRSTHPEFTDPRFSATSVQFDDEARWLVLSRGPISVGLNFSESAAVLPLVGTEIFRTADSASTASADVDRPEVPGQSAVIVKRAR